jgi:hypothetical protein
MKRHRSVKPLLAVAGVAALGMSGMSCSSNTNHSDSSIVSGGGGYTGPGGYIPGTGVDALVFVKRQHTTVDANGNVSIDVAGGNGQVIDYLRYVPGGGVYMLKPARPDGQLTNLTKDFTTADIAGLDLSFNAADVVFSMKKSGDDHYHVYTLNLASNEIHQKTFGDNDDINPIYVPGDRIVFVTNQAFTEMGTRADEYNHGRVVTQLASVTISGGDADRKLCSQNLSHTVNPFLRYDGSVGYSRWEHLGGVNDVKLFRMAPDCTQMIHVAGQFGKPSNSLVQVSEISPNVMVGIATNRERTIQAGSLVKIDSQTYANGAAIVDYPRLDSEHVKYDVLTPSVPTGDDPSPAGRYRNPRVLPDGRLLVSWADGMVNDINELSQTPPDFGIYIYDPKANSDQPNQLVYNDKNAWDLYAIPLVQRNPPPVIGSVQNQADGTLPATLGSLDVKNTDLLDNNVTTVQHYSGMDTSIGLADALKTAVKVRVIEGFSSEGTKGVTMFGLTMDEGAAVLGEATVYGDGSWLANVPSYIPVHLQPLDKFGLSIRNQRLWIQGMPGESRVCGGCHESRTGDNTLGINQNPTVASTKGAERFDTTPIAQREEYPWNKVQTFLTANCVSCHNDTQNGTKPQTFYSLTRTDAATGAATTYTIPTLSFTDKEIAVYYDRKVMSWATSYVSIFYPATLDMMPAGGMITGTVPPKWGVPESARESVLIEKLNVKAADGTYAWDATTHKPHPEDVGGPAISDADRLMMIKVMDLGGQYYSRQNGGYVPNMYNPTAGKQ